MTCPRCVCSSLQQIFDRKTNTCVLVDASYDARTMATAVCIVGDARGFAHPNVTHSLKSLVQLLGCGGRTDVFLYLRLQTACPLKAASCGAAEPSIFSTDQFGSAVQALEPVAIDLDDRRETYPGHRSNTEYCGWAMSPICKTGTEYSCKFFAQFDKIARCYEMVQAHEKLHRVAYDWVARLRPDIHLYRTDHLTGLCRGNASRIAMYKNPWNTYADHFARMKRADAQHYFRASDGFSSCHPLASIQPYCHQGLADRQHVAPECFLSYHLNRLRFPRVPFSNLTRMNGAAGLVRGSGRRRALVGYW